jgi:hypothetical protein
MEIVCLDITQLVKIILKTILIACKHVQDIKLNKEK